MSLRHWIAGLAFVGIFCASLLAMTPASTLNSQLEDFSGGKLLLVNAQGTIWGGSGILLLQNDAQYISMGNYAWKVVPAAILRGVLEYEVRHGESTAPMHVRLALLRQQAELSQWNTTLPAQVLCMLAPQLRPYQLNGEIKLTTDSLLFSPRGTQGKATVDWTQAGSGLTDVYPLGDYRILMEGEGQKLTVQLSTLSGKLRLTGRGQMEPGKGLSFNGTAQAAQGEQQDALSELLHHVGPETTPGIYSFGLISH